MRVVAGKARSILLDTPRGLETRPTTDRIKETLFNMLQGYVPDAVVFDAFAGSGGLGIEALSRGSRHCYFSDVSREAIRCVTDNVKRAKLENQSDILLMDYQNAIMRMKSNGVKLDLVLLDPPYGKGLEFNALRAILNADLLAEDALVVVEASIDHDASEFFDMGMVIIKDKIYKSNRHYFLKKEG